MFGTSCGPHCWSGVIVRLPFEELSSSFDSPLSKCSTSTVLLPPKYTNTFSFPPTSWNSPSKGLHAPGSLMMGTWQFSNRQAPTYTFSRAHTVTVTKVASRTSKRLEISRKT
ncbi:unnamed protein product [Ixodes persulcatus]